MQIYENRLWVLIPLLAASTVQSQMNFQRNERAALAVYYRHQLDLLGNYTVTCVHEIFANILNDSDTLRHQFDVVFEGHLKMLREFNARAAKIQQHTALHEIDLHSLVQEFMYIHTSINTSSSHVRMFFNRKFEEYGMTERYEMFMQKYRQFFEEFIYNKLAKYLNSVDPYEETAVRQWRDRLLTESGELKRLEMFGNFLDVFTL